jgi:hypothetical protein
MSDSKYTENDPERTLITLDQLSQTIEVMTSVVNRLRQHLSEQVQAKKAAEQQNQQATEVIPVKKIETLQSPRDSFVIEITQHEKGSKPKDDKILH